VHPRRVDGVAALGGLGRRTLVVIGNFDGVHTGHQRVLLQAAESARRAALEPIVLTFDPHPALVLGRPPLPALTALDRKVELIAALDPALRVVVEPFTLELARLSPDEFARSILVGALHARRVAVGANFRFGQGRAGDFQTLVHLGERLGFAAEAVEMAGDARGRYSSTRVRDALSAGDLDEVFRLLGRPHSFQGVVSRGAGRGRTIGVPTANLEAISEALPPFGVYACLVDVAEAGHFRALAGGVANLGVRPTLDAGFSVEVHLFDFGGDLYGRTLRVHLAARLREERKFPDLGALRAQIARDSAAARGLVAGRAPGPAGTFY
jgi:riboflavin kinase / FMN adenylyltransferase